jgi:hypothetical protein
LIIGSGRLLSFSEEIEVQIEHLRKLPSIGYLTLITSTDEKLKI